MLENGVTVYVRPRPGATVGICVSSFAVPTVASDVGQRGQGCLRAARACLPSGAPSPPSPDSRVEATGLLAAALCQGPAGVSTRKEQSLCLQELAFQLGEDVSVRR